MAHPAKEHLFDALREVEAEVERDVAAIFEAVRKNPEALDEALAEVQDLIEEYASRRVLPRVAEVAVRAADRIAGAHGG